MKQIKSTFVILLAMTSTALFFACKSTEAAPVAKEQPVIEAPAPAPEAEPEPEVIPEKEEDAEYSRSIGEVQVDVDTYTQDKAAIMQIISELDTIMQTGNYKAWLGYIDQESIDYYKLRPNLQKAEKKMPIKGIKLTNLEAYFKFVFVQARKGREVSEIRYVSDSFVKAVQVQEDKDVVYYYFKKVNGTWKVNLPPIED